MEIKFGNRTIGLNHPTYFIADIAANHDGDMERAKKLLRLAPRLMTLPALRFTPSTPARYGQLRKEPRPECWSTLESVHHVIDRFDALGLAKSPAGRAHDHLLDLLERTIERQLAFEPPEHRAAPRGERR